MIPLKTCFYLIATLKVNAQIVSAKDQYGDNVKFAEKLIRQLT